METFKGLLLLIVLSVAVGLATWWASPFDGFWLPRFVLFLFFEASVVMSIFGALALIAMPFALMLGAVPENKSR